MSISLQAVAEQPVCALDWNPDKKGLFYRVFGKESLTFPREVNPYKKVATFCKLFLCRIVDQGVHRFFFISVEHIVKQSKTMLKCYKIIFMYKQSIYYIHTMTFKDIQYSTDIQLILSEILRKSVDTIRKVAS